MENLTYLSESSECNNYTLAEAEIFLHSGFQRVFIIAVVPVITLLGLSTNGAFLMVVYRIPKMRTATNFYLSNLAVADGVLLMGTTLNYLLTYLKQPIDYGYPFESGGCMVSLLVIYVFSFASIAFLTLVALERYQAVCRPLEYRHRNVSSHPLKDSIKYTFLTWVLLIIFVSIPISFVHVERTCVTWPQQEPFVSFPAEIRRCQWARWSFVVIDTLDICFFTIALIINCLVYLRIVQELNKRKQPKGKSSEARSHVARMLSINAIVFFACLFPIQLSSIAEIYQLVNNTSGHFYGTVTDNILLWIGRVAFLLNSTVNPIIYNAINPEYRKAFQRAFSLGNLARPVRAGQIENTSMTQDIGDTMELDDSKQNQERAPIRLVDISDINKERPDKEADNI